jgi:hypothetical protein
MVISDLQHIESATETDVQGGCKHWWCWSPDSKARVISIDPPSIDPLSYNTVGAEAEELKLLEPTL